MTAIGSGGYQVRALEVVAAAGLVIAWLTVVPADAQPICIPNPVLGISCPVPPPSPPPQPGPPTTYAPPTAPVPTLPTPPGQGAGPNVGANTVPPLGPYNGTPIIPVPGYTDPVLPGNTPSVPGGAAPESNIPGNEPPAPPESATPPVPDVAEACATAAQQLGLASATSSPSGCGLAGLVASLIKQASGGDTEGYGDPANCHLQVPYPHLRKSGGYSTIGFKPITRCEFPGMVQTVHNEMKLVQVYDYWFGTWEEHLGSPISDNPVYDANKQEWVSKNFAMTCKTGGMHAFIGETVSTIVEGGQTYYATAYSVVVQLPCGDVF
ncbi:hypothetical protein ACFXHA_41025 [Nocardia sp. NPDC059240]|uniref:hypothetical protein n=1 Tax=Nocardia sp. NPDC059240 TaxID=3346786 RepID=UPI0036C39C80